MRHAFNGKTENPRRRSILVRSFLGQRISNYTWKLFFPSKSNDLVTLLLLMSELHTRERLSSYRASPIRRHLSSRLYAPFFFFCRNTSNNAAACEWRTHEYRITINTLRCSSFFTSQPHKFNSKSVSLISKFSKFIFNFNLIILI